MRTVRSPSPRRWSGSWPPAYASATASSSGSSPAASASSGTATWPASARRCSRPCDRAPRTCPYHLARNEQAHGARRGRLRPDAQPAAGLGLHRLDRARARPTCSPAPRSPPSTASRCCCCPATSSPPGSPARCCRSSRTRRPTTSRVNDAFRPVSRFFDRVWRPEQLPSALLGAMRVLTDPAETGAVTLALPQDVQAEAYDWPEELFAERVWHVAAPGARARRAGPGRRGHPRRRGAR